MNNSNSSAEAAPDDDSLSLAQHRACAGAAGRAEPLRGTDAASPAMHAAAAADRPDPRAGPLEAAPADPLAGIEWIEESWEELQAQKVRARLELLSLPPAEAQARADVLFGKLWEPDPEQLYRGLSQKPFALGEEVTPFVDSVPPSGLRLYADYGRVVDLRDAGQTIVVDFGAGGKGTHQFPREDLLSAKRWLATKQKEG